ncbi:hypothetical protein QPK14_19200 [Photorhabdus temperata subsp. temperata]|nr:hypothetical protein [Photorhabdus temperata]
MKKYRLAVLKTIKAMGFAFNSIGISFTLAGFKPKNQILKKEKT